MGDGASLNISNSTISDNRVNSGFGAGVSNYLGTVTISDSTISNNRVFSGNSGGGVSNELGTATINNSTISGNTSGGLGGGIDNNDATMEISNSTIYWLRETNSGNTNIFYQPLGEIRDLIGIFKNTTGLDLSNPDSFNFV